MVVELEARPVTTPKPDEQPLLAVQNARVAYGDSVVVEGASIAVQPGQCVCIMGRNGAGKTTLMKATMGTLQLRGGSVLLDGQDVRRWPSYRRARAGIGYVPQGRGIFPYLTVRENLLMGLESVKGVDSGQLDEVMAMFPVLGQMAGRTAGVLSGGQQQQLAMGRALMGRPRLLLLDEPTEGIQPSIMQDIQDTIASFRGKLSVLLVEQFLDFALAVADYCYVMDRGSMVLEGAPADLDEASLRQYLSV